MRLFILSMPAVALVAVLSVSLQHSMMSNISVDTQSALPEATRIYQQVMLEQEKMRGARKSFQPLAAKRPVMVTPALGDSGSEW